MGEYLELFHGLFWFLAGLWNVAIALLFWDYLLQNDEKMRKGASMRVSVFVFGLGYWAVGLWGNLCSWIMVAGILGKFYVAVLYFGKSGGRRTRREPLEYVIVGDVMWAIGFALFYFT
jgi:hypothetical protein